MFPIIIVFSVNKDKEYNIYGIGKSYIGAGDKKKI